MPEKVATIDLGPYVVTEPGYHPDVASPRKLYKKLPYDGALGRRAAKETKFVELLENNDAVVILIPGDIYLHSDHTFLTSFLRLAYKAVGGDVLMEKVRSGPSASGFNGLGLRLRHKPTNHDVTYPTRRLVQQERQKEANAAKRKAKKAAREDETQWSEPIGLFLPEIGTLLRLTEGWPFMLHQEGRNVGVIDLLGLFGGESYHHYRDPNPAPAPVRLWLIADSELLVDRIYIRKGAEDYSSLSFWLSAGAKIANDQGEIFTNTKKIRFWAKLQDVNNIKCVVNKATVPGMK